MTASGVLTSCATPAASRPMEESFSAWASWPSICGLVGDVVDEDDAADGAEIAGDERRDGDVGDAGFFGAGLEAEFVEVVDAGLIFDAAEFLDQVGGEDGFEGLVERFLASEREHDFHLRIPALDALFGIEGEDADVDGFDDVLVEFLEALVLVDLFFEAGVEGARSAGRCRCSRPAIRAAPYPRWRGSRRRGGGPGR